MEPNYAYVLFFRFYDADPGMDFHGRQNLEKL